MRILVAGAGAVGSYLGASLAAAGAQVTLVARDAHGAAMTVNGVTVLSPVPRYCRLPVFDSVSRASEHGPYDLAIVAVKSYVTASLAEEWAAVGAPPVIVSFQNGIGNEECLAATLPDSRVVPGCLTRAVQIVEPGIVSAGSRGGVGLAGDEREVDHLAMLLEQSGVVVRRYANGAAMKWSKLLLNLIGAASAAVLQWPPTRVLADRRLFDLELGAWREALAVMRASGLTPVDLPSYPVAKFAFPASRFPGGLLFRFVPRLVARERGDRLPGAAADLAHGLSRTEIEVLNGAVADRSREVGVPAPINALLREIVADLARGSLARQAYIGQPDAYLALFARRLALATTGR